MSEPFALFQWINSKKINLAERVTNGFMQQNDSDIILFLLVRGHGYTKGYNMAAQLSPWKDSLLTLTRWLVCFLSQTSSTCQRKSVYCTAWVFKGSSSQWKSPSTSQYWLASLLAVYVGSLFHSLKMAKSADYYITTSKTFNCLFVYLFQFVGQTWSLLLSLTTWTKLSKWLWEKFVIFLMETTQDMEIKT